MITHIDLFAGISGFGLGFERAGIETVAHVEIDAKCQEVIRHWWPGHLILSDICQAGAHNLPYADIITFGSPCQDLSVAGKRDGLTGGRSGLFFEAVRIIREIGPRYAVWENVPGALSSHSGRDFKSIIESLLGSDVPMPRSGRWASAGMVRIGEREVAWRILDAQYFGVAQRRRRVFVVASFGNGSCAEILFECEGVQWNPPARTKTGENIAFDARNSTETGDVGMTLQDGGHHGYSLNSSPIIAFGGNNTTGHIDIATTQNAHGGTGRIDFESETFVAAWDNRQVTSKANGSVPKNQYSPTLNGAGQMMTGVRRLTPTECERLQGFPDNFTFGSDSTRYKQLGNAVAVPCAEWIGRRLMEVINV